MNDKQNIADLIGALAEDIEEIKKKLDAQGDSDKDDALKRLAVKLEPVIRFFGGNAPENIGEIFGSKEAIEKSKKSLCDGVIVSMEEYTDATNRDMCKRGIPTIKDLLRKILEMQAELLKNSKAIFGKVAAKPRLYAETLAGYSSGQDTTCNKAAMGQSPRWLVQEPLCVDWHRLYNRILYPVYRQLGTMA